MNEKTEETYEQFDTDEASSQENKNKKMNIFSPKNLIKYILITLVLLCFIILLYNIT